MPETDRASRSGRAPRPDRGSGADRRRTSDQPDRRRTGGRSPGSDRGTARSRLYGRLGFALVLLVSAGIIGLVLLNDDVDSDSDPTTTYGELPEGAFDIDTATDAEPLPEGPVGTAAFVHGEVEELSGARWWVVLADGRRYRLPHRETADPVVPRATLSPDGSLVAYPSPEGGLALHNLVTGEVRVVPVEGVELGGELREVWSPDSRWLLFDRSLVDTTTGEYREVPGRVAPGEPPPASEPPRANLEYVDLSEVTVAGVLPDGNLLAVAPTFAEDRVVTFGTVSPAEFPGGEYREVDLSGELEPWEGADAIGSAAGVTAVLSPDGTSLAFTVYDNRHEGADEPDPRAAAVVTVDLTTARVEFRTDLPARPEGLRGDFAWNDGVCGYGEPGLELLRGGVAEDGTGEVRVDLLDPATRRVETTARLRVAEATGVEVVC